MCAMNLGVASGSSSCKPSSDTSEKVSSISTQSVSALILNINVAGYTLVLFHFLNSQKNDDL